MLKKVGLAGPMLTTVFNEYGLSTINMTLCLGVILSHATLVVYRFRYCYVTTAVITSHIYGKIIEFSQKYVIPKQFSGHLINRILTFMLLYN